MSEGWTFEQACRHGDKKCPGCPGKMLHNMLCCPACWRRVPAALVTGWNSARYAAVGPKRAVAREILRWLKANPGPVKK